MMQPKLKQCSECPDGKLSFLWKSNPPLCRYHAQVKTAKKQVSINQERTDKREKFYQAIHKKFNGICQETGKQLTYSNKHCAHILPKSKYDYFEFDLRNGILVSWNIHAIIDRGSPEQRKQLKVWKRIQDIRSKLLDEVGLTFDKEHWEIITF